MAAARTYTSEQLLHEARELGAQRVSRRLIYDWVSLGLLKPPDRRGLGRGRGTVATWPEGQRRLFLDLVRRRQKGARIPALCNVPVYVWLYWPEAGVPTEQVRRALKTWSGAQRRMSLRWARKYARQLIGQLAHPESSRAQRRRAADAVALAAHRGRFDLAELTPALGEVFDPDSSGRILGPEGARLDPETWIRLVLARLEAVARLDELDDAAFEAARALHRRALAHYVTEFLPAARPEPGLESLFRPPDHEQLLNAACNDLVTVLGLAIIASGSARHEHGMEEPKEAEPEEITI